MFLNQIFFIPTLLIKLLQTISISELISASILHGINSNVNTCWVKEVAYDLKQLLSTLKLLLVIFPSSICREAGPGMSGA